MLTGQSSASENEIVLNIDNLSFIWNTLHGDIPDTNPIGNLSKWFSLVKEATSGGVSRVYFPNEERESVIAFKKSLAQLISLSVGGMVERSVEEGGMHVVRQRTFREQQQGRISIEKVREWNMLLYKLDSNCNSIQIARFNSDIPKKSI